MSDQSPPTRQNLAELAMTPVDHGIAAMERQLLALGVPIPFLARILMQHAASIISLAEPAAIRAELMKELISNFPQMVRRAQLASATTTGGVILPHARPDALEEIPGA
jgi:hypothetical protein